MILLELQKIKLPRFLMEDSKMSVCTQRERLSERKTCVTESSSLKDDCQI